MRLRTRIEMKDRRRNKILVSGKKEKSDEK